PPGAWSTSNPFFSRIVISEPRKASSSSITKIFGIANPQYQNQSNLIAQDLPDHEVLCYGPIPNPESRSITSIDSVSSLLSGHEHNYDDVRCAEFGLGQGARREHIPKWICDRRATPPQAKCGATLRAAVLFRPDFVARSSQTPEGYAGRSRLAWPKNPLPRTSSLLCS